MARKKNRPDDIIRATVDTMLLSETVWVGTTLQAEAGLLAEGLCIKQFPNIKIKLDDVEEPIFVKLEELWVRRGFENNDI